MLYWLTALSDGGDFFNLFRYITFRAGGAFLTALIFGFVFGKPLINVLRRKQGKGQPIRDDGPQTHLAKAGTPTMGGLLIVGALLFSTLMWARWDNPFVWMVLFVTMAFGLIGFADDYAKVSKQNTKGVPGKVRLALGFAIAILAALWASWNHPSELQNQLALPVFKVVDGSNISTTGSEVSERGRCSTPRGTTMKSPSRSSTGPSRKSMAMRPRSTRKASSSCSCACQSKVSPNFATLAWLSLISPAMCGSKTLLIVRSAASTRFILRGGILRVPPLQFRFQVTQYGYNLSICLDELTNSGRIVMTGKLPGPHILFQCDETPGPDDHENRQRQPCDYVPEQALRGVVFHSRISPSPP